jgi:hypothetical protein
MNFITHFALDRKTISPYFTLGVAIPDLLPLAGRQLRVPYKKLAEHSFEGLEEEEYFLLKGILHHYYTDRVFHESEFFNTERRLILPFLKELFLQNPDQRYFFLTHLFVEFYLDRIIQLQEADMVHEFYSHIAQADFSQSLKWLEDFSQQSFQALEEPLQVFQDRQYLHAYRQDEGFLYALNRTIKRTGIIALESFSSEQFHEILKPYEIQLKSRIHGMFPEIHKGFDELGYQGITR